MKLTLAMITALTLSLCSGLTVARTFAPAILFNSEVVMDNAYNEQLLKGVQTYAQRKDCDYVYKATAVPTTYRRYLEQLVAEGRDPILTPGTYTREIVREVAAAHPDVTFITIDYSLDLPNVHAILFREAEASYLAGVLAAHKSGSGKLGFIGGMPIPAIHEFESGFMAGALSVDPTIEVERLYLSDLTDRPFDDPEAAYRAARSLLEKGSDILFAATGSSGQGAMRAAKEAGALAIGVDSNQNGLYPGTVLTSVLKNLDRAVYVALVSERWGLWRQPVKQLGLAQGGVGLAMDNHNAPLISERQRQAVTRAREAILKGHLVVSNDGVASQSQLPHQPPRMRVILPAREQWPYITDPNGPNADKRPGLFIDALNLASEQLGVEFDYDRQPLRRGSYTLSKDKADAMLVRSIDADLKARTIYPMVNGQPDASRALMQWDLAVYRRKDGPTGQDYRLMPIGVPPGTRIADNLQRHGVTLFANNNLNSRLGMLMRERVNTVVADPLHADYLIDHSPTLQSEVIKTADSVGRETSYLLVSNNFYRNYPQFCEELWNRLSEVRESVALWDRADRYFTSDRPAQATRIPTVSE
ncbi:BMP family ABC transporter substrate-binding protein [Marinobacter halodurans]|nr:BMP family ABC transporter substrate-binding protein [Marinobacter halodurans]